MSSLTEERQAIRDRALRLVGSRAGEDCLHPNAEWTGRWEECRTCSRKVEGVRIKLRLMKCPDCGATYLHRQKELSSDG